MNDTIITSWNSTVGKKDKTIVAGDFCFGYKNKLKERLSYLLPLLNGEIILVKGNHDHSAGDEVWKSFGYDVVNYLEVNVENKQKVCISHYPFSAWNKGHYGSVMLHGHCHGSFKGEGRIIDVGWDVWGRVMPLQEIVDFANKKAIVTKDMH